MPVPVEIADLAGRGRLMPVEAGEQTMRVEGLTQSGLKDEQRPCCLVF